jgi:mannitol-1-phosphate 5-dehydrogenase
MQLTESRLKADPKKIVIFGAGRIGRSFIGQLFGCSGYKVVFVDVDREIVRLLNEKKCYRVVIKGDTEDEIVVPNVSAIDASDKEKVTDAVCSAGIAAVSVGKFALGKVIPVIAAGLEKRLFHNPFSPLDIILAENHRSAAEFTKSELVNNLPENFPVDSYVGLLETSIGKMVPIIPAAEIRKDPLVVFAEPYNSLILDGKGFKTPVPDVKGLAPKKNIKAWVDRKAFIHNLGHATAAYYGFYLHPEMIYMYEILSDKRVHDFTRSVMLQSASVLARVYPDDLPFMELEDHVDDLIKRFRNVALQDTIFRVGSDLIRKLGIDDRFMGAVSLARDRSMPYNLIINAMSFGFRFKAKDEEGRMFPDDIKFHEAAKFNLKSVFTDLLEFDAVKDSSVINELIEQISKI